MGGKTNKQKGKVDTKADGKSTSNTSPGFPVVPVAILLVAMIAYVMVGGGAGGQDIVSKSSSNKASSRLSKASVKRSHKPPTVEHVNRPYQPPTSYGKECSRVKASELSVDDYIRLFDGTWLPYHIYNSVCPEPYGNLVLI